MELMLTILASILAVGLTIMLPFALMYFSPLFRVFVVLTVVVFMAMGIASTWA